MPDYHNLLGIVLSGLALLLLEQGETMEAEPIAKQAVNHQQIALQANPKNPDYRQGLRNSFGTWAETLVRLGKHVEAVQAATELTRVFPDRGEEYYLAAGFAARCVSLVDRDDHLPKAKCQELAQAYGDRAMTLLREAVQKGYRDAKRVKEDKDLDALRGRDEFKVLLKDLEELARADSQSDPN